MSHKDAQGYEVIRRNGAAVHAHVAVAEKALGRALIPPEEVHHANEDKGDNRPANLVICPDRAYHMLLHLRARAYRATGDASLRQCKMCKQWDSLANLSRIKRKDAPTGVGETYHKSCHRDRQRGYNARRA